MARKTGLADEEVELEIAKLQNSPYVKLARKEQRIRYRRRQFLYGLRDLEKKGKALAEAGVTLESLDELDEFENEE